MKPETARKHFIDPFRYWHPVTNNDVQKLKRPPGRAPVRKFILGERPWRSFLVKLNSQIPVASNQQNKRYYFAFCRVFIYYYFFYFSIAYTLSGLALPQINVINESVWFEFPI